MARPTVPIVEVELDKVRHLRFDFNAAARFEQATGKNLLRGNVLSNLSATDLVALLWACLKHEDVDLTLEDIGAMVHFGNIDTVADAITRVYTRSSPTPAEGEERPMTPTSP